MRPIIIPLPACAARTLPNITSRNMFRATARIFRSRPSNRALGSCAPPTGMQQSAGDLVTRIPDLPEFLRPPCTAGLSVSTGCSNFCRYCFVENKAAELGVSWRMRALPLGPVLDAARSLSGETVQVPVTHDVTPSNVDAVAAVVAELLPRDNRVVIVTKPFESCIDKLTAAFPSARQSGALSFRLSVTSDNPELVRRWEPGAPSFDERLRVLKKLSAAGWTVGLSIAPMLDIPNVVRLFRRVEPFANDTIYVAKMAEGEKLRPRGRLTAADIETLRAQCADVELLAAVHEQLATSPLFSPKFCVAEYDAWAFGSESTYYDRLKAAHVAGAISATALAAAIQAQATAAASSATAKLAGF